MEEGNIRVNFSVTPATEDLGAAQLEDQLCDLDESILHIKQGFAERLKQDVEQIAISFNGETLSDATTLRELGSDNTVSLLLHHNPSPSNHTQPTGEDSSSPTHSTQQDDMPQTQEGDDMPPTQEGEEDTPPTQEGEEDTPPTQERETTPPAQEGEEDTPPTQGDEDMTPTQEGETAPQREEDTQEEEEDTPPAQEQEDTCPTQEGETASPTQGEEDTPPTQGGENAPTQEEGLSSSTISPTHPASGKDLLITTVPDGRDTKEVMVKIERSTFKKPFLGGYRHRVSEMEYHHAAVQTLPRPRPRKDVIFYERDSQTIVTSNKCQQVAKNAATQMDKNGCYINPYQDKIISITGVYETADEYHERVLSKVIILQSYWRRWLAMCFVRAIRRDKLLREEWERAELARRKREREEHASREFHRRMNPRTKQDFDLLYHALEMWRQEEMAHIDATTSGAERKAALCGLLEQEAQLIASIGRHKVVADEENRANAAASFLSKAAAPRRWIAFDGGLTEMNTPYTLRAEQLRDIYSTLIMQNLSQDERLDVLLTLKSTVKEHDCKLTREIVELVNREADLLMRGIREESLRGLRKRISSLFLQYCKTPFFNPEAAKHIKIPQDIAACANNIYYCRSCSQYLPSTDFELSANSKWVGHCRACRDLDNQARAREDWSMYRMMLKTLRKSEEAKHDQSHIIFLMQEADLCYLVENIWGSQSALSACTDLYELRMVRWQCKEPWSPWNTLLVTRDEAAAHEKLENLDAAYGRHFVQKIQHKHFLAQHYFSRVPEMAEDMKERVRKLPLPKAKEMEITVHMNIEGGAGVGVAAEKDNEVDMEVDGKSLFET